MSRVSLLLVLVLFPLACSNESPPNGADGQAAHAESGAAPHAARPAAPPAPEVAQAPAPDPALHDAFDALCNAAERSGATPDMQASERAVKIADWIKAEVKSKEVLDLMGSLATMSPERRGPALRDAARAAGVEPCPLADES